MSLVVVVQPPAEAIMDTTVLAIVEEAVSNRRGFIHLGLGMDRDLPLLVRGPRSLFLGGLLKMRGRALSLLDCSALQETPDLPWIRRPSVVDGSNIVPS